MNNVNKAGKFDNLKAWLKENMTITVEDGDFTNPNSRTISIELDGEVITRAHFDVVQKREYEE